MAAKRAMQAIIHTMGTKYDCPMVITPIKSRKPVTLLALVCRYSILCLTTNEQIALITFTSAISPIILVVVSKQSHGVELKAGFVFKEIEVCPSCVLGIKMLLASILKA